MRARQLNSINQKRLRLSLLAQQPPIALHPQEKDQPLSLALTPPPRSLTTRSTLLLIFSTKTWQITSCLLGLTPLFSLLGIALLWLPTHTLSTWKTWNLLQSQLHLILLMGHFSGRGEKPFLKTAGYSHLQASAHAGSSACQCNFPLLQISCSFYLRHCYQVTSSVKPSLIPHVRTSYLPPLISPRPPGPQPCDHQNLWVLLPSLS